MPMYECRCFECGERALIFRTITDRDKNLPKCAHGDTMVRVISPTFVQTAFEAYQSPSTGKWIESRDAQREDLRASNCILMEPGLKQDIQRNKEYEKEKAFEPIAKAIDETVTAMNVAGKLDLQ